MSRAMQFDIVANDKASSTMQNVDRSMDKFGKGITSKFSAIATRATAVIATLATVTKVINEMGDVSDQAARLGLSVEMYQKLKFAAEDYGSSVEEIAKAQKDINKLLDAAATKKQGPEMETLQALGFSNEDIINRAIKQAEVFERVGEAIKGASSEEEKFAIASRVFGDKIATSLVPVLENYGEFNKLMASTETMSQKSADNLDKVGANLSSFWNASKAATGELAGRVAGLFLSPEGPKLAETPETKAAANAKGSKMRNALLKVGTKKAGTDGAAADNVSSMMAIGGSTFQGIAKAAKPIEEQQLEALNTIASNTSPDTQHAPTPASTDITKATSPKPDPLSGIVGKIHQTGSSRTYSLDKVLSSQRKSPRPAR